VELHPDHQLQANARDYVAIVAAFREITAYTWRFSQRCCKQVKGGVPECCYQIVDGAELTFTPSEMVIVQEIWPETTGRVWQRLSDGMWVLQRDAYDGRSHLEFELNTGWLANTLECASHPLRPIIGPHGQVMGTVAVKACNASLGIGEWSAERDAIRQLWQKAVDMTGLKPYYVSQHFRSDMMLI
jgi:hypothetical protein